jgi:enterochelin esterase family protein
MNPLKSLVVLSALLVINRATSQPLISPEVDNERRVTFRLKAPEAKDVKVRCEGVKANAMQKDEQGVWSMTTEAMEPDIYVYSFTIDGVHAIDPANPLIKYNLLNIDSQVHVPGSKDLLWEVNDVTHGELHRHFYKSAIAGDERDFIVYTPPGYNAAANKRYPTLYLLHGYSDDTTAWSTVGCANIILDNLIARKLAQPMVIVMPLGYGTMEIVKAGWQRVRDRELWEKNQRQFRETLLNEVVPQVEAAYRISTDQTSRAIAGLSMGGTESLLVGLGTLDKFGWVGAFSSGGLSTNFVSQFPNLDEKANDKLWLLWIGCGTEDGLMKNNRDLHEWLTSKNIRHTWKESPGAHSFRVWRRYLGEFAPMLFQQK